MLLSIVSLLFITIQLFAEPTPTPNAASISTVQKQNTVLCGLVFDKLTQETLAGAIITANGQKAYTDLDGNFSISNVCGDKCKLKISMISYEDQTVEIDLQNQQSLTIKLQQR